MSTRIFVPGRIEVLGKHTDYAGGSSLLIAVERGFTFEAEPLDDDRIVFVAEESGDEAGYTILRRDDVVTAISDSAAGRPSWARYVDGVLERTIAGFGEAARGARIRFRSDLPVAAGLSSSSALVCGAFLALDAVSRFSDLPAFQKSLPDREALAGWLSAAEMGGPVGTRGGSEDHVAILCARADRIVRYGLAPVRYRGAASVPEGWVFAVAVSGVVADKGGAVQAHYNRLSDLATRAARAWAAGTGATGANLGDALEHGDDANTLLDGIRAGAAIVGDDAGPMIRRARHFLEECDLVDAAFVALERGDVGTFAGAANRSATLGAELLENQVPETMRLTALARALGAPAASPFGGGFGGAVWALVRDVDAERFLAAWHARYLAAFPDRTGAEFFTTRAGVPAQTAARGGEVRGSRSALDAGETA